MIANTLKRGSNQFVVPGLESARRNVPVGALTANGIR
jgi:hypothetical protein